MEFIDGLFAWAPRQNAPSFKKATLSIDPKKLSAWLAVNQDKVDAKGFLRVDILESKKGGYYAKLDTWKPTKNEGVGVAGMVNEEVEGIPF